MTRKSPRYPTIRRSASRRTGHLKTRLFVETLERRDVPSFVAPHPLLVGPAPSAVVSEDLNGDGLIDIAVAVAQSVRVFPSAGDGAFLPPVDFPTLISVPTSMAATDVSGDGQTDLVVTGNGAMSVLPGTGTGFFRGPRIYSAGKNPTSIAVADFNNDALPDLVVANVSVGVTVFLGQGGGTFQQSSSYNSFDTKINAADAADFNGDGFSDIVAVGYFKDIVSKVAILLGKGDGTFSYGPQYGDGRPVDVSVADFNADQKPDLAVVSWNGTVAVYLGNGDGTFEPAREQRLPDTSLRRVETGDIDSDGNPDFMVLNEDDFGVFFGNGDGTFQPVVSYVAGINVTGAAIGDYTGDGVPDIALANKVTSGGSVTLHVGLGAGEFAEILTSPAHIRTWETAVTDLNDDGIVDLLLSEGNNGGTAYLNVMLGRGDGTFKKFQSYVSGSTTRGFAAGDYNSDGILDVAVGVWSQGGRVRIALGAGGGVFGAFVNYEVGSNYVWDIATDDLDSDGDLDLAISIPNYDSVRIMLGNGDGSFGTAIPIAVGDEPRILVIEDFNGDGRKDMATANELGGTISVLLGNGDGSFQPHTEFAAGAGSRHLIAADLDNDGMLDVAVTNTGNPGTAGVLLGNGDGTFGPPTAYVLGNWPSVIAGGDVNGDGVLDLIVSNRFGGTVSLLVGEGDGTFKNDVQFMVGTFPLSASGAPAPVTLADTDQNGWLDIVAAREDSVGVILNDGIWPPLPIGGGLNPAIQLGTENRPAKTVAAPDENEKTVPEDRTLRSLVVDSATPVKALATTPRIRPEVCARRAPGLAQLDLEVV